MRDAVAAVLDLLLPAVCPCCGAADGNALCRDCRGRLMDLTHPCPRCALPRDRAEAACTGCGGDGLPPLREIRCRFAYQGTAGRLVRLAKMAGPDGIAAALPAILDLLPDDPGPGDRIVPVPPARDGGGVHLAGAIAHALARRGGRPIGAHDLRQIRRAHRQRSLSLPERQRNVADLFAIRRPLHPCHVLLVDDILTTGATLAAAARVLRAAGARRVDAFCFCRTVLDGAD